MKLKMYTVYDSKAEAYKTPFFMQTKGLALRSWEDTVNDQQTTFYKHPGDFTLFEVGEYDDQTGEVVNWETKISLGTALEFIERDSSVENVVPLAQKAKN